MTDLLAEWVKNPVIVGVALAVLTTIISIIWKSAVWKTNVDRDRRESKDAADKDRAAFKETADKDRQTFKEDLKQHRSTLQKFMVEIRDDIKKIFLRLPPVPVASSSPLKLTDFGEKIAKEFEAREWATGLTPTLAHEVEGKRAFEIDEFSEKFVGTRLGKDWEERVAGCAYDFGIKRDDVRAVLRVVLRDELIRLTDPPNEGT